MPRSDDSTEPRSDAPAPPGAVPGGLPRRLVLKGAAGAGLAVAAAGAVLDASAPAGAATRHSSAHGPVVAHVRDARTGEIDIYSGDRQVTVHDRALAARLLDIAD